MDFAGLPLELSELVLMRTFRRLFIEHESPFCLKRREAIAAAYSALSSVCYNWWQTMNGWPQSSTCHWLRHRLQHFVQCVCSPYSVCPRLQFSHTVSHVAGVAQCDNKLFVIRNMSDTMQVFGLDGKQQTNIRVKRLKSPYDIVACNETKQLYIADNPAERDYVWRVSLDGRRVDKWLTDRSASTYVLSCYALSLTSRRLLVTSFAYNCLLLFGPDGVQLKHVKLSDIEKLRYAAETSRETFIVCHCKPLEQVSEVDVEGRVIRVYCNQQPFHPYCLALDSHGRVFVADRDQHRVLLLNSRLELERVLIDAEHHQVAEYSWLLLFDEQTRQLIVAGGKIDMVQVYSIRH